MKKKIIIIMSIILVIIIAAVVIVMKIFGGSHRGIDNNPEPEVKGESNILVAYFSWSGNGQQMARWIAEETGGELFRIVPTQPYSENYDECAERAKNELDKKLRPELAAHIDADIMAKYDVIYLGFPVWWYDLPMPVWSFLEEYDLSGKTIIPFFSHNGSSSGANSVSRVTELAVNANVLNDDALSIRGSSVSGSEREIKEWASGFKDTEATDNSEETTESSESESSTQQESDSEDINSEVSVVYMTEDISPEGLMAVYEALEVEPSGNNIAVKLSTGEPPNSNYLDPALIKELVQHVDGTIVECNTAYGGSRSETAMHYQVAKDHGFTDIAEFEIMDEKGSMIIPVNGGMQLSENYVGASFGNYDGFIVLSHFKGHAMAGFGGAIKNISIGIASSEGKCLIHTAGNSHTSPWGGDQDAFLEAMADAGKSVVDYLDGNIIYINVMNRLSIDCDCDGNPSEPDIHDIGILASTDPVALDQACVDLIYSADGNEAFVRRMEGQNAIHVLEAGEEIGLGSRTYKLIIIDN